MIVDIVIFAVAGVMTGGLYALLAVGLSLIFGVLRFVNFAHGEMLMLGAYVAIFWGLLVSPEPYSTVPAAFMAVLLVGMIIARISVMPIAVEGRIDEKRGLVLSIGLSMLLMNLALAIFGPEYRSVPGAFVTGAVHVGPLTLEGQRLVAAARSASGTFSQAKKHSTLVSMAGLG